MDQARIEDLDSHPRMNIVPRMSDAEFKGLVADIKEQGILDPLLVTAGDTKYIVDGHNRFEAAKKAGLEEVPIREQEMTEEQILEYMLRSATSVPCR